MSKIVIPFVLVWSILLTAYAQEAEIPLSTFDVKATTDIHYPENASQIEITWIERKESTRYITEHLKADILKEITVEEEQDEMGYSFMIFKDSSYWKIRIKPLARYQYGVYELRELTGEESPVLTYNQELHHYLREQLNLVEQYKDSGDLLGAARVVNYVIDESTDSSLIAEAMHKMMGIGHQVAERFNDRHKAAEVLGRFNHVSKDYKHAEKKGWQELIGDLNEAEQELFKTEGISLGRAKWSNSYVYVSYNTLQELAEKYATTKWGELAALTLITESGHGYGLEASGFEAIELANSFLEKYPDTAYRSRVYRVIAYSYSDELRLGGCYEEYEPADMAEEIRELKEMAIKYFLLSNDGEESEAVRELREGKCPQYYYLHAD